MSGSDLTAPRGGVRRKIYSRARRQAPYEPIPGLISLPAEDDIGSLDSPDFPEGTICARRFAGGGRSSGDNIVPPGKSRLKTAADAPDIVPHGKGLPRRQRLNAGTVNLSSSVRPNQP